MAKHVTTIELEKTKSGPKRIVSACGQGLYYHVEPSNARSWHSRLRFHGKPINVTLGPAPEISLKTARAKNAEIKATAAAGIDPRAEKKAARAPAAPATDLVQIVAAKFIAQHVLRNLKSPRQAERIIEGVVVPFFRGRRLGDIRKPEVYDFRDAVRDQSGPVAANRAVSWASSMGAWAVEREIIETNPFAGLKRPARETPRTRILSDLELQGAWLAHGSLGTPYDQFFRLLVLTGQRKSEIAGMRWAELDFERRVWILPASRVKNNREHTVPLSDLVVEILDAMPRIGDFVFTISGRVPISTFTRMKQRIDEEMDPQTPWVLHDLRRTAASGMARLGIALPTIEKVLNHVSGSFAGIVSVYQQHDYDREKRAALEAWSRYVDNLMVIPQRESNVVSLRAGGGDEG